MGLFGNIVSKVKGFAEKTLIPALKQTSTLGFLTPQAQEAKAFIEKPGKQTARILGETALGLSIASPSTVVKIGKKAIPKVVEIIKNPKKIIQTTKGVIQVTALGGVIGGGGLYLLPKIYEGTKKATELVVDIVEKDKPVTNEDFVSIGEVIGVGLGAGLVGAGVGYIASKFSKDSPESEKEQLPPDKPEKLPDEKTPDIPILPSETSDTKPASPQTPLTPSTQVLGKEVGQPSKKRKKGRKLIKRPVTRPIRVNVVNAFSNKNIINNRRL